MSETSINGRPYVIPIELPSISEAMRIIDADVGQGVRLAIRVVDDDPQSPRYDGRMWQELPAEIDGVPYDGHWGRPGDVVGEITTRGTTQAMVVRRLAAIITASRTGGQGA